MLFKPLFILINLEYNYIIIYTDSNDFTYWKSRSKKSSKNQNFSSIRSPRGGYCFPLKLVRRKNKLLLKVSKSRRCEKTPSSPLCGTMQTRHWFFTSFNSLQRGCDSDIYIGIHGGGEIPAGRRIHKVKSFLSPSSSPYWSSTIPSTLFLSLSSRTRRANRP